MKISETGSALSLAVLGIFMAWQSDKLTIGTPRFPGPGFFPFFLSLLLIGISAVIAVQGLTQKQGEIEGEGGLRRSRVVLALLSLFLYALVLDYLGYLIGTFLLVLFLMSLMVKKSWWFCPLVSALITVASYALFKTWMEVLLPRGLLGF